MTYKFVTREDFDRASTFGILPKLIDRLFSERDAYRKVAINHNTCYVRNDGAAERVDAEAAKLLESK